MLFKPTVSLLPHQKEAVNWMAIQEKRVPSGGILAHDMGLGKTVTTIHHLCSTVGAEKDFTQTLIIVPTNLFAQWQEELKKFILDFQDSFITFYNSQHRTDIEEAEIVLTTYDTVVTDGVRSIPTLFRKWRRIVLDEAHEIRNPKSQRSRIISLIPAKTKWCLTGTPIWNDRDDLLTLYNFIAQESGFNTDTIYQDKSYIHIRGKELLTLPNLTQLDIMCNFSPQRLEHYKKYERKVLKMTARGLRKDRLANICHLRKMCNDTPKDFLKSAKLESEVNVKFQRLYEFIDETHMSEKIVVFSQWATTLQALKLHLEEKGIHNISMFHGELSQNERQRQLNEFKQGENRILLITVKCGAVGLNLVCANHICILEPQYSPFAEKQAIDRVYRIGQNKNVCVYRFYIKHTIEAWMISIGKLKIAVKVNELDNGEEDENEYVARKLHMFQKYVSMDFTLKNLNPTQIKDLINELDTNE